MKMTFTQKHPFISVVLVGLLCTFMTGLGAAIPQIMGLDENTQLMVITVFLVISIGLALFIMKKSRVTFSDYGFCNQKKNTWKKIGFYIPMIVIELLPIVMIGFQAKVTLIQYFILLFFTVAVGFHEEIYFRGLALKAMSEKGKKAAIIWTSVVFGFLHLINVLNGKNLLYLVLQMFFAFLVGLILAQLVSITKSLWGVIIWHAMHDFIANITGDSLDEMTLIVLAIQVVILVIYGIFLWKNSIKE